MIPVSYDTYGTVGMCAKVLTFLGAPKEADSPEDLLL